MIIKEEFEAIEHKVFAVMKECLSTATANQVRPGEIMVFFIRGNYNPSITNGFNPHTINQRIGSV